MIKLWRWLMDERLEGIRELGRLTYIWLSVYRYFIAMSQTCTHSRFAFLHICGGNPTIEHFWKRI